MSMVTNLAIEQKGTLTRTRTMGRGQKVTSMPIIVVRLGLFYLFYFMFNGNFGLSEIGVMSRYARGKILERG